MSKLDIGQYFSEKFLKANKSYSTFSRFFNGMKVSTRCFLKEKEKEKRKVNPDFCQDSLV